MRETSYAQARKRFAALLDQVTATLAGWIETAHLMRSPKNAQRLLEAVERTSVGGGGAMAVDELRQRLEPS